MDTYKIDSVLTPKDNDIKVRVQINGTRNVFTESVKTLYTKPHLQKFNSEDAAHIGVLMAMYDRGEFNRIEQFPMKRKNQLTTSAFVLCLIFAVLLMASDMIGKIVQISTPLGSFLMDSGCFIDPIAFGICDILTEVYGYRTCRFAIWMNLFSFLIVFAFTRFVIWLPVAAVSVADQQSLHVLFDPSWRMLIGCALALLLGEFLNSMILSRMKLLTRGKHFWLRVLSSNFVGTALSLSIFFTVAYAGTFEPKMVGELILTPFIYRMLAAVILIPILWQICAYLKKKDAVDAYDYGCSLNPFSLDIGK